MRDSPIRMSFMDSSPSRGRMAFHSAAQVASGYGALSSTRLRERSIPGAVDGDPVPALLASAADADEALAALLAGADIVDLKDPSRGALGACGLEALARAAAARDAHAPDRPLSAALGPARDAATAALAAGIARLGFAYLKTGLDGARDARAATALLRPIADAARRASPTARLIAAAYADAPAAGRRDRKSTRLNSSHLGISYAVFCLKK